MVRLWKVKSIQCYADIVAYNAAFLLFSSFEQTNKIVHSSYVYWQKWAFKFASIYKNSYVTYFSSLSNCEKEAQHTVAVLCSIVNELWKRLRIQSSVFSCFQINWKFDMSSNVILGFRLMLPQVAKYICTINKIIWCAEPSSQKEYLWSVISCV